MGKYKDLIGQKFGHLQPIQHLGYGIWDCLCDCGNTKQVRSQALRTGHTKSCGCLKTALEPGLVGQRFGRLSVIKKTKIIKDSEYLCLCDCGNTKILKESQLLNGSTHSCGCYRSEKLRELRTDNLIGDRYGYLLVTKFLGYNEKHAALWECQCDCGQKTTSTTNNLHNGSKISCGCIISKGERKIADILLSNNIFFIRQKIFDNCRFPDTNHLARFDFWVNDSYIVEYDGPQHYYINHKSEQAWNSPERFQRIQFSDNFKNQFCFTHNIPIIRIPFFNYDTLNIDDLKLETSNFVLTPDTNQLEEMVL